MQLSRFTLSTLFLAPSLASAAPIAFEVITLQERVQMAFDVASGDFDGDGNPDIVTSSKEDGEVLVLTNPGGDLSGTWVPTVIVGNLEGAAGVAAADFDGDGDVDVVAAGETDQDVAWYENPLIGSNAAWDEHIIEGSLGGAIDVAAFDVNGDGNPDIVAAGAEDDDIIWYRNPGPAEVRNENAWTDLTIEPFLSGVRTIAIGDVDGDGISDIVAAGEGANDVAWYKNVGGSEVAGNWAKVTIDGQFNDPWGLSIADFDGDGAADIVAMSEGADLVVIFFGSPDEPGVSFTPVEIVQGTRFNAPAFVESADLDLDGDIDFVMSAANADLIFYFDNPGGAAARTPDSWTNTEYESSSIPNLNEPLGLVVEDFDGNGRPDVANAALRTERVVLLINPNVVEPEEIVISSVVRAEDGGLSITFEAQEGAVYRIDSTTDFVQYDMGTPMDPATAGPVVVPLTVEDDAPRRFYRVVQVSP